jgi:pimeloyl-ACP methyl ester carboxylesterase
LLLMKRHELDANRSSARKPGDAVSELAYTRIGAGAPLVLLHGIGMSRRVWDPVIPVLAERFDVIAVDLPGFGDSPLRIDGAGDPATLAASVADLLDELDITAPHVAGNSLGGWVAIELAARRRPASLTLLSPAGMWRNSTPVYCRISLRASRSLARRCGWLPSFLVRWRIGRIVVLGQTHGRPWALTPDQARRTLRDMGDCPGFDATMKATTHIRCDPNLSTGPTACPVTVAFGSRDWLLRPRQSRCIERLPGHRHIAALPGCGHVPMADDAHAVTAFIAKTASEADGSRRAVSVAQPHDRPQSR